MTSVHKCAKCGKRRVMQHAVHEWKKTEITGFCSLVYAQPKRAELCTTAYTGWQSDGTEDLCTLGDKAGRCAQGRKVWYSGVQCTSSANVVEYTVQVTQGENVLGSVILCTQDSELRAEHALQSTQDRNVLEFPVQCTLSKRILEVAQWESVGICAIIYDIDGEEVQDFVVRCTMWIQA